MVDNNLVDEDIHENNLRISNSKKLKYISGVQVFLGVGLVVCAVLAVVKHDEYNHYYFVGGLTCGFTGALAGSSGICTAYKASTYTGDSVEQLRKELFCTACFQVIMIYIGFFLSVFGIGINIDFLVNHVYLVDEDKITPHVILSAIILSGIILLLLISCLAVHLKTAIKNLHIKKNQLGSVELHSNQNQLLENVVF